eukprot:TRINITY_DN14723_c0_g1_i1.p1 TRINITY_DN14723_c0_g1~~TRINITY_DN14723_c0_g1_i1.p1  ORF type:complete len:281 (-),score=67.60 TRINITY_DN14723_c0_g1_i1:228-1070(-)
MTHNLERTAWWKEGAYALGTGVLYGSTSIAVGHPFDTIKTKMQAQSGYLNQGGFVRTLVTVVRNEGVVGLYRGWLPPLWGSAVYRSLQFAVYEALYTKWNNDLMVNTIPFSGGLQYRVVAAGVLASTSRSLVECPVEYAKVKRQTGQPWHLSKIYTGMGVQWARTCGLMTSYFVLMDYVRRKTNAFDSKFGQFLASGGCATVGFWIVWPFETLKNQVQAETQGVGSSLRERAAHLIRTHGPLGLFRGIVPGTLSIFLRNGAAMVVMQYAQRKLSEHGFRR